MLRVTTLAAIAAAASAAASRSRLERDLAERDWRSSPVTAKILDDMDHLETTVSSTWVTLPLDTGAACLDGSPYMFAICKSTTSNANWTIGIQGGGWCYDELDCLGRAGTPLGSSKTWGNESYPCNPAGTLNYVQLK
jgi:hypothetical protein